MSDLHLTGLQSAARRISNDAKHPRQQSARKAIPLIEAEIRRRADALDKADMETRK
jgi:hypothetical protein